MSPQLLRGTTILSGVNRKCYSKWWDHHGESVWSEIGCGPRIDSWQTQYLKEDWRRGNHEGEHSRIYQRDNVTVSKKSIEIMAKTFFFCEVGNMEIINDFGKMVWTSLNAASKRMKIVLFCFAFSNCWRIEDVSMAQEPDEQVCGLFLLSPLKMLSHLILGYLMRWFRTASFRYCWTVWLWLCCSFIICVKIFWMVWF